MPDGDHIYGNLNQAYEGPYQEICEWAFSPADIAGHFDEALRTTLKHLGDAPVVFLQEVAEHCAQLPTGLLFLAIDWRQERLALEHTARACIGSKRGMDLALEVSKVHLQRLQQGETMTHHGHAITRAYLERVFQAEFEEKRPLGGRHPFKIGDETHFIDEAIFRERLNQLRPYFATTFDAWARHIAETRSLAYLRSPAQERTRVTADTNLLAW